MVGPPRGYRRHGWLLSAPAGLAEVSTDISQLSHDASKVNDHDVAVAVGFLNSTCSPRH